MAAILYFLYIEHGVYKLDEVWRYLLDDMEQGGNLYYFLVGAQQYRADQIDHALKKRPKKAKRR